MGDVSGVDGFVGIGEEGVIPPHRKQRIEVSGVFDPAHDQPSGDRGIGGTESGVGGFGDFGIGDPCAGVGVAHCAGVVDRGPGVIADGLDGRSDGAGLGQHQREVGTGASAGIDHGAVAVGRVSAHQDLPADTGGAGGGDCLGDHPGCALAGVGLARPQPGSGDHRGTRGGADGGDQRREAFAQDLLAGDLGVSVGGSLFGVAVDRAQQ